jgi:hypothetical protein
MLPFLHLKSRLNSKKMKRTTFIILVVVMSFSWSILLVRLASAQGTETVVASIPQEETNWLTKAWDTVKTAILKAGAIAYQRTLASALNKIAYDTANYIGSGGQGQKPLYVTQGLGAYINQIGDEAGGQFLESFVNNLNAPDQSSCQAVLDTCYGRCDANYQDNLDMMKQTTDAGGETETTKSDIATYQTQCYTDCDKEATGCASSNAKANTAKVTPSFHICSPSSIQAKLKIALGLVKQNRPASPDCTASKIINNWADLYNSGKATLKDHQAILNNLAQYFDPSSNDLGIYVSAQADMLGKIQEQKDVKKNSYVASNGWLDLRDISGTIKGVPGEAQKEADSAAAARREALGKTTGDIFVDAANVFLNQLYYSSMTRLLQSLTEKTKSSSGASSNSPSSPQYGESILKQETSKLLKPNFGTRADYNVLSDLAVCTDPKNPGPDNCVIDDSFVQAISEKKTVAEAIADGSLHGNWQITNSQAGDSYHDSYSARNIAVLVKYRILPVGWAEVARIMSDSNHPHKATLSDLVSCFDPKDEYTTFSDQFSKTDPQNTWCQGLVDPNWVLKAPLNYCQKQGFGSQITNKNVVPAYASNTSALSVTRADNYCADNETCIKEKSDGSCEKYGYCNEDKRTWSFNTDTCQPINNTCQNFTNTDSGKSVSYLQNTLDYTSCVNNVGCRQYALSGAYDASSSKVAWSAKNSLYFNKTLGTCSHTDEGCTELMRFKSTWGSNLVMDADFRGDLVGDSNAGTDFLNDWPLIKNVDGSSIVQTASIVSADSQSLSGGGNIMKLTIGSAVNRAGISSDAEHSLLPADFQIMAGQSYALSADVYLSSGDRIEASLGDPSAGFISDVTTTGSWQHIQTVRSATNGYNEPSFSIIGYGAAGSVFYIKNVKFELSEKPTDYSSYGSFKVYEKLLPNYLESSCYADSANKDYSFKANAPKVCSNYARKCNQSEVGCELYKSTSDNFSVPAKVSSGDYCPKACLGYDAYIVKPTYFNASFSSNLIPAAAKTCTAAAVGCNEFTNLDSVAQGGEQREYYTSLRQCIKPSQDQCTNFYAWQGQASGYQLQSYFLKKQASGAPDFVQDDSATCNEAVYNYPLTDPRYNADCQKLYDAAGKVYYHLLNNTITCSDNCHPYRLSASNSDGTCLNGGVWDSKQKSCIYQAIPGEGQTCQASENGCREYDGNSGSNVKVVAAYDFEDSQLSGWSSNCSTGVSSSTVANSQNGHSLFYNNDSPGTCNVLGSAIKPVAKLPLIQQILADDSVAAVRPVNDIAQTQGAYTIKFMARASHNTNLKVYFFNNDKIAPAKAYFNAAAPIMIKGGNEWNFYQANLTNLDHVVTADELLVISADGNVYLDNFLLSQITDRYYLIKDSSQVPAKCSYDVLDNYQGPEYNLGCSQYVDRDNLEHDLNRFSQTCSNSAVGCEQMIDTKNSSDYRANYWFNKVATSSCDVSSPDCVKVAGDQAIYAVYDASKQCNSASKGCSRFGQGQGGSFLTSWLDVFANNNPDKYAQTLCGQAGVGCEEWKSGKNGDLSYFKDPGFGTCVYRASHDLTVIGKAWYKSTVKRCDKDSNGKINDNEIGSLICLSNADCTTGSCIADNNDYPCSVAYLKTIGQGGDNNQVPVPDKYVGICASNEASCTEYVDPVSRFSANLVNNANYQPDNNGVITGWGGTTKWNGSSLSATQQIISLTANKLYSFNISLSSNATVSPVTLNFLSPVRILQADNTFGPGVTNLTINSGQTNVGVNQPIIFDALANKSALVGQGDAQKNIEVKELAINYQLADSVDLTSCTRINFNEGCVLFNQRSVNGDQGLAPLPFDAYNTPDTANGTSSAQLCAAPYCQANQIVKVSPDRVCNKWLDCTTYIKDQATNQKTCYAFGECDRLNDQGECDNFVANVATTTTFDKQNNQNASGYSLDGSYNLSAMREVGSIVNGFPEFTFEQQGGTGFNQTPGECVNNIGISFSPTAVCPANFDKLVIKEPVGSPTDYPAHGTAYLAVPAPLQLGLLGAGSFATIPGASGNFYLSYLANTHTSNGLQTKVIITDDKNVILKDKITSQPLVFYASASQGWQSFVNRFNLPNSQKFKVFLTSNTNNPSDKSYVYFDDVRIEPVLDMGNNSYATRDCRLYPASDSLTCSDKNQNTINNGLEGYCLKYDPANPGSCLLWYPLDHISAAKSNIHADGYKGKIPLNYCTEANGNFQAVEKREISVDYWWSRPYCYDTGYANTSYDCGDNSGCLDNCYGNTDYWKFYYEFRCQSGSGDDSSCCHISACIPKNNAKVKAEAVHLSDSNSYSKGYSNIGSLGSIDQAFDQVYTVSTHGDYDQLHEDVELKINFVDNPTLSPNGWYYPFDGFFNFPILNHNTDRGISYNEETAGAKIYDFGQSKFFSLPNSNHTDDYSITCNRFVTVVDNNGENAGWSARLSNAGASTSTPDFFFKGASGWSGGLASSTYPLYHYNQAIGSIPFGAANLPNGLNASVGLLSQDISVADPYAGRPYGCTGVNCKRIGSCSKQPNLYCLINNPDKPGDLNDDLKDTCPDIGDICVPLWYASPSYTIPNATSTKYLLGNIFLRSYGAYVFNSATRKYDNDNFGFDFTSAGGDTNAIKQCAGNVRINSNTFCAVYPTLSNVSLFYGDNTSQINPNITNGNEFNVAERGIYRLEFNSLVDPEQMPLSKIVIDWGDNSGPQTVTDQDQAPTNPPHTFYHYYTSINKSTKIHVIITDNWGQYDKNF